MATSKLTRDQRIEGYIKLLLIALSLHDVKTHLEIMIAAPNEFLEGLPDKVSITNATCYLVGEDDG